MLGMKHGTPLMNLIIAHQLVDQIAEALFAVASMPRWAKIAGGVVAVAALMGAIAMLLMPPPPPHLLAGLL